MAEEAGIKFPESLDGFVPNKLIGAGGFGHVWLAQQRNLDRPVAIKVGRFPLVNSDSALRFERECAALGRLTGKPHIVDVYTSGLTDGGVPYLVMEYVDGGTLRSQGSQLSEAAITTSMMQLCKAIQSAHNAEILHRDLKPENVFLRHGGEIVVGDFGIARLADREHTTGGVPATLLYAAPEVLAGEDPTYRSDVYGIGVTMASVLLGRSPFDLGGDAPTAAIIARILEGSTSVIDRSEAPPHLADAINRAMMRDPMQRPATAAELADLLGGSGPRSAADLITRVSNHTGETGGGPTNSSFETFPTLGGEPIGATANQNTTKRSKSWMIGGIIAVVGIGLASIAILQGLNRASPGVVATSDTASSQALSETTVTTPTTTTTQVDPNLTRATTDDESSSGATEAGAPVSLGVSEYSFPLELAAGDGCQPDSDQLPDGIWFVTFPTVDGAENDRNVEVNLICAFDAAAVQEAGYEPEFVGWLFEDRSNVIRVVEVASGLDQSWLQDDRAYRIEVSWSVVVSISPAG